MDLITSTSVILRKSFFFLFFFFDKLISEKKNSFYKTSCNISVHIYIILDHLLLYMYKLFPFFNIIIRNITFIYVVYGKYILEIIRNLLFIIVKVVRMR